MAKHEFTQDRLYCELIDDKEVRYLNKASLPFAIKTVYDQGLSLNPEMFRRIGNGGACELGGSTKDMSYTPQVELNYDSVITYSLIDNVFSMAWLLENGFDYDLYQSNPRTSRRVLKVIADDISKVQFPKSGVNGAVAKRVEDESIEDAVLLEVVKERLSDGKDSVEVNLEGEVIEKQPLEEFVEKEPLPELTEKDWHKLSVPRTSKKMIKERAEEYGIKLVQIKKEDMLKEFKDKYEGMQSESN